MGTFNVAIQVGDLAGQQFVQVDALADSGSAYTWLPGSTLIRLGVEPMGWRNFETADGRIVQYEVGHARCRVNGNEVITLVVFGPEDAKPLLGAVTLETFGLGVDPVNQRLISVPSRI